MTSGGTTVSVTTARGTTRCPSSRPGRTSCRRTARTAVGTSPAAGSITTDDGVTGVAEEWQSSERTGRVVVFLDDGIGVEIVISSSYAERAAHQDEIDAMVASAAFTGDNGDGSGS